MYHNLIYNNFAKYVNLPHIAERSMRFVLLCLAVLAVGVAVGELYVAELFACGSAAPWTLHGVWPQFNVRILIATARCRNQRNR